jgi:lysophospholipase L1-like esterase
MATPAASSTARLRELFGKVLLAILAPTLLLGLLEGVARVGLERRSIYHGQPLDCMRRSRLLGYEYVPHCRPRVSDTPFETNSLGLRDREVEEDGAHRILAIGDSCTWGWRVPQEAAYPQVLQRLLDARYGPRRYRTINAGAPGRTSYHGLLYLRDQGLALRPSIVIAAYSYNDSLPSGDAEEDLAFRHRMYPLLLLDDYLLDHAMIWGWLRNVQRPEQPTNLPRRVVPEKFERNLRDVVSLARDHGAAPLLVNLSPSARDGYSVAMRTLERELGVPLVNYQGDRMDLVHPTREGYEELAASVLERLETSGYVH